MMAVIGQSHLLWRSRVPDHIYHGNAKVRIVPILLFRLMINEYKNSAEVDIAPALGKVNRP